MSWRPSPAAPFRSPSRQRPWSRTAISTTPSSTHASTWTTIERGRRAWTTAFVNASLAARRMSATSSSSACFATSQSLSWARGAAPGSPGQTGEAEPVLLVSGCRGYVDHRQPEPLRIPPNRHECDAMRQTRMVDPGSQQHRLPAARGGRHHRHPRRPSRPNSPGRATTPSAPRRATRPATPSGPPGRTAIIIPLVPAGSKPQTATACAKGRRVPGREQGRWPARAPDDMPVMSHAVCAARSGTTSGTEITRLT